MLVQRFIHFKAYGDPITMNESGLPSEGSVYLIGASRFRVVQVYQRDNWDGDDDIKFDIVLKPLTIENIPGY